MIERGYPSEEAVALTCAGSWAKHSERLLAIIRADEETGSN